MNCIIGDTLGNNLISETSSERFSEVLSAGLLWEVGLFRVTKLLTIVCFTFKLNFFYERSKFVLL